MRNWRRRSRGSMGFDRLQSLAAVEHCSLWTPDAMAGGTAMCAHVQQTFASCGVCRTSSLDNCGLHVCQTARSNTYRHGSATQRRYGSA